MIVCSCAVITDKDIRSAVEWMRAADPQAVVTPGKVYRALGKRPVCGGCVPLFIANMELGIDNPLPMHLRGLRAITQEGRANEGRSERHRVSEPGTPQRADSGEPVLAALSAAE
ncbi:(2Fe-2S)-binding protein [Limibaculum sp. M0105]|uniref:(2Fe-2S)-binding protein n=1 Tax=Thermohalobaculum xanthum TaxID=2753746 RepID=A0A8J7SD65_9RHOB|nr:(2Fe-2S)-binding protein [Thermohalobaculum xanthum]MBK0398247.1 (2Fe-2S)-binding protein [Thermohalobaculum xanthum]